MYSCIHCGSKVESLFKKSDCGVYKLSNCDSCKNVADKYVECDTTVVLIDLILFKKASYRHVIFNTEYIKYWKIGILIFIVLLFEEWTYIRRLLPYFNVRSIEKHFYYILFCIGAGTLTYVLMVTLAICSLEYLFGNLKELNPVKFTYSLIMSNFGLFFLLPSLIWTHQDRNFHSNIVKLYTIISQIQALQVVTSLSKLSLGVILTISLGAKVWIQDELRATYGAYFYN